MTNRSPYDQFPDTLSEALVNPMVNVFEHEINWPRFKAMLPAASFYRILDFGCGPGNFTRELVDLYPGSYILGVDESREMLPDSSLSNDQLAFKVWDGRLPLPDEDNFGLIIAKLSLHYIDNGQLKRVVDNLVSLLLPGGSIAISVPHPYHTMFDRAKTIKVDDARDAYYDSGKYTAEIGNTGITGLMMHRKVTDWINVFLKRLRQNEAYDFDMDEVCDVDGVPKRVNIIFSPMLNPMRT